MFKKIDLYIIRKFIGTYFYSIGLIIAIAVIFDLAEKIDDFFEKNAPLKAVLFDYYLNFVPYFANLFSSLFTFIAVIFFTSKMAYNTEIIAILSSGVSFARLMRPYLISAFIIAVFSGILSNFIIPPANRVRLDFEEVYIKNQYRNTELNIHRQIRPGEFIYFQSYYNAREIGQKFSMEKFVDGKLVSKLMADNIQWDTTINKWKISNYYIRDVSDSTEKIRTGNEIDTTLNGVEPDDFRRRLNFAERMNYTELREFIAEQEMQGASNLNIWLIEKHMRFAYPFSTFILAVIGMTLSCRKVRGGMGMHIGLGVLLSFSYLIFMRFATTFAISGFMSPFLATWLPNFIFALISVFLYIKAPK